MPVHKHSLEAYHNAVLKGKRLSKCHRIIELMLTCSAKTDREISECLGCAHKSEVQPRISDLIKDKVLQDCGERFDAISNTKVRLVRLTPQEPIQTKLSMKGIPC